MSALGAVTFALGRRHFPRTAIQASGDRACPAYWPRGVGDTKHPPGLAFNPDIATQEILHMADAAKVDRFAWLGYSYGGAIGVQLACRSDRVTALAVGGFPPLNAPFKFMSEFLTRMAEAPPPQLKHVDPQTLWTAAGFYRPLVDWPERVEVPKLAIPRLVFMGDQDTAQGMPEPWSVPLAEQLSAAEGELRVLNWEICWLAGHDHLTAVRADVALPCVQAFLRRSLLS